LGFCRKSLRDKNLVRSFPVQILMAFPEDGRTPAREQIWPAPRQIFYKPFTCV